MPGLPFRIRMLSMAIYRSYTGYLQVIHEPCASHTQGTYRLLTGHVQAIYSFNALFAIRDLHANQSIDSLIYLVHLVYITSFLKPFISISLLSEFGCIFAAAGSHHSKLPCEEGHSHGGSGRAPP